MDVNEELKFSGKLKKKKLGGSWGGGVGLWGQGRERGGGIIIIIIIIMTLFKEEAQLDKVQSSLRSSIKQHLHTYIQTYREFYNNY